MKTISRYIMTLALLLTAVTGAWAQSYEAKVFDVPASWAEDETPISAADLPKDFVQITEDEAKALAVPDGIVLLIYGFDGENVNMMQFDNGTFSDEEEAAGAVREVRGNFRLFQVANAIICYTAEAGLTVAWNASTKTGNFAMPGSDVVLTPIYAKAAAFATTGTEPEVKTLLPEAAEGVIAGTDAPLIAEGTGIVAFAGTSTEVTQGTLMYAIGTSATQAPALTAAKKWSATVPTAKNIPDDGATLYVWYYIQGADAPQGEAATLDNTFDNTEPACLTVQVLTNKFDIQFNAANANTIEAGKATVTVAGAAATVTDGKLQGVKMGSEVKLEAKPGYKFRKVEVKKNSTPTLSLTNPEVGQVIGSDGKNYAAASVPSGVDKVAMIAYVSGSNGLAIALADEGSLNWATAISTCEAKTPAFANGTWKLPTQDEWKQMFSANGGNDGNYNGLNTTITNAGGTTLQELAYWSSTPNDGTHAYGVSFYSGLVMWSSTESKNKAYQVRACLAF